MLPPVALLPRGKIPSVFGVTVEAMCGRNVTHGAWHLLCGPPLFKVPVLPWDPARRLPPSTLILPKDQESTQHGYCGSGQSTLYTSGPEDKMCQHGEWPSQELAELGQSAFGQARDYTNRMGTGLYTREWRKERGWSETGCGLPGRESWW